MPRCTDQCVFCDGSEETSEVRETHSGKFSDYLFSLAWSLQADNNSYCSRHGFVIPEFTVSPDCKGDSRSFRRVLYDLSFVSRTSDCNDW